MGRGLHPKAVALTTPAVRRRRSPLERLATALPGLTRSFGGLLLAYAPVRLRVAALAFAARGVFAAWTRRDWELNTFFLAPDYELLIGDSSARVPGMRERYHGIDGYLEAQLALVEVFADWRVEMEAAHPLGSDSFAAFLRFSGSAEGSGVPITQSMLTVAELRRGLVVRQRYWWDARSAARELGLEPPRR